MPTKASRRRRLRPWLALAGAVLLAGPVPPAAGAGERVSVRIVNGSLSFGDPSVGALLRGGQADSAVTWCSGTLVGCRTFVTAAHCVCDLYGSACQSGPAAPDPGEWLVFLQHAGLIAVESIAVHPGFSFPQDDVAVVRLAAEATGVAPSPLAAADPPLGTDATIVGFGRSGGGADDYGLKRRGAVVTAACAGGSPDGLLCWDFESPIGPPGTDSNTCNGDSGGPLFAGEAGTQVLAGITSGGSSDDCLPADESYDTSVAFQRGFIEGVAGADLGTDACGELPAVGGSGAEVLGFSRLLDSGTSAGEHAFEVPEGARRLRVALNASEDYGANFDLYVRAGSAPTALEWDCRAVGPGQFGFCEFASPAPGPWHVRVGRVAGTATYQVTATWFSAGEDPPPPPPAGPQSRPQRQCLNRLAEAGALVAGAQTRDALTCMRNFARGRVELLARESQPRTAQACLDNDVDGRVARAQERTLRRDDRRCLARAEQEPDFGYRGAGPVNAAARSGAEAVFEDLFGGDLDASLAAAAADEKVARCQADVASGAADVFEAVARQALEERRAALRGRDGRDPARSAAELEAALAAGLARDAGRRIGRARSRLEQAGWDACPVEVGPLAALFPGDCAGAGDVVELTDCAFAAARCRACRALADMDGLDLDCDTFDDGAPDLSCP